MGMMSGRRTSLRKFYGSGRSLNGKKGRGSSRSADPGVGPVAKPETDYHLFCGFSCENPSVWSESPVAIAGHPNADFNRGGVWACEDEDGNAIDEDAPVPYGGTCSLTCEEGEDANQILRCWRTFRPTGHLQYQWLHQLYNELLGVDVEDGEEWTC